MNKERREILTQGRSIFYFRGRVTPKLEQALYPRPSSRPPKGAISGAEVRVREFGPNIGLTVSRKPTPKKDLINPKNLMY